MIKILLLSILCYCSIYSSAFANTLLYKCLYTDAFTSITRKYHKDTLLITFTIMPNGDIYMNGDKEGMSLIVKKIPSTNTYIITIIESVPVGTYTMTTIYPDNSSVHSRNTLYISNNSIGHQASQYYGACYFSKQ